MNDEALTLDSARCVLIIMDLQNDVIIDGGAFAETGSPDHAREQNVVANVAALAATCRSKGIPVIHVWNIVEEGGTGSKMNAPLFQGVKDTGALVREPGVRHPQRGSSRRMATWSSRRCG